ncbi:MAG: nitroreductase family protein [Candidatus Buchananbacteria bacterium]
MDVKNAIKKRRSIRKYKNKQIPNALIKKVIDAARLAPSGNNTQPCTYYVVKDEKIKSKLKKYKVFAQDFVYTAPVIIVCCADPIEYKKHVKGWDLPNKDRALRDVSIASSFLVLAATELGLGTCYIGWLKAKKIKEILQIPKQNLVPYVITVGYPDEKPKPTSRKSLDKILF